MGVKQEGVFKKNSPSEMKPEGIWPKEQRYKSTCPDLPEKLPDDKNEARSTGQERWGKGEMQVKPKGQHYRA